MALGRGEADVEVERRQHLLDAAAQLLPMLQRARRMEHQRRAGRVFGRLRTAALAHARPVRQQRRHQAVQQFAQVAREGADAGALSAYSASCASAWP